MPKFYSNSINMNQVQTKKKKLHLELYEENQKIELINLK